MPPWMTWHDLALSFVHLGLAGSSVLLGTLGLERLLFVGAGFFAGTWRGFAPGDWTRGIGLFELIAQIAPVLGLLGTVLGIMDSLQGLSQEGDPRVVLKGVATALDTTAWGLILALVAVVFGRLLGLAARNSSGGLRPARELT